MQTSLYLLLYTLLASLPLHVGIGYLEGFRSSLISFNLLFVNFDISLLDCFWYCAMVLAFLVNMPIFLVYLWLPMAHVEAPVSGS